MTVLCFLLVLPGDANMDLEVKISRQALNSDFENEFTGILTD